MKDIIIEMLQKISGGEDVEGSENLLEDGMLDSLELVSLVSELETAFCFTTDWATLAPEDFYTVDTIVQFVKRCQESKKEDEKFT